MKKVSTQWFDEIIQTWYHLVIIVKLYAETEEETNHDLGGINRFLIYSVAEITIQLCAKSI